MIAHRDDWAIVRGSFLLFLPRFCFYKVDRLKWSATRFYFQTVLVGAMACKMEHVGRRASNEQGAGKTGVCLRCELARLTMCDTLILSCPSIFRERVWRYRHAKTKNIETPAFRWLIGFFFALKCHYLFFHYSFSSAVQMPNQLFEILNSSSLWPIPCLLTLDVLFRTMDGC